MDTIKTNCCLTQGQIFAFSCFDLYIFYRPEQILPNNYET